MTVSATKAGLWGWFSGMATVPILGIPAGALVAALVAAALNNTGDRAVPGRSVPRLLQTVVFHAFIGGWVAMAALKLSIFRGHGVQELGATITAALVTLCVPWIRENAPTMAREAWQWLLSRFGGKR